MEPANAAAQNQQNKPDLLELYKNLKLEDFARYSEKIIENLGYSIKKVDLVNGNTINMLVYKDNPSILTGVFVRRGIGIIQDDHIKNIEHFMSGMQTLTAIMITPNDFNPTAKKKAEKKSIRTINGDALKELLNQIE
ncbi:MAG: restriction endonuclease [Spirochaetia bacterium]|nr:restriction endonuclease [Spirochaetia bacterium]